MADRTGEIAMESTMEHEPTPATVIQASPFHRLPPEMVHAILCQVQGLSTLGSAVRSCRWLYDVFLTDKARIMTRAVVNELDAYDVRPEVEAAWRASQFVWDKRNLQEYNPRGTFKAFCKRHLAERSVDLELGSTSLNSDDVSAIWRLHSIVSRLTRRYAEGALRKLDRGRRKGCTSLLPLELSVAETGRIMRAFYFLETYYNLFRDVGWMSSTAHYTYVAEFLCHFSGCEMEQFRTIDGFLFSELQPNFYFFAKHDAWWGPTYVHFTSAAPQFPLHNHFSQGLALIEEAMSTERDYDALLDLFRRVNFYQDQDTQRACDFKYANRFGTLRSFTRFQDPDDGPAAAYRWIHGTEAGDPYMKEVNKMHWRMAGYVMFDKARLEEAGALQGNWQDVHYSLAWPGFLAWPEDEQAQLELQESGEEGYWDRDDESG